MVGDTLSTVKVSKLDLNLSGEQILIEGQSDNGNVKVVVDGNKTVRQILISPQLFNQGDKQSIENLVMEAINLAINSVDELNNEQKED